MIEEWEQLEQSYKNSLKWMNIHSKALISEDIDYRRRTDYVICPLCGLYAGSDSTYNKNIQIGYWYMSIIEPKNPRYPTHEEYLIWSLNKHLKEYHDTTPEALESEI